MLWYIFMLILFVVFMRLFGDIVANSLLELVSLLTILTIVKLITLALEA